MLKVKETTIVRGGVTLVLSAAVAVLAALGVTSSTVLPSSGSAGNSAAVASNAAQKAQALTAVQQALAKLPVKGRAPLKGGPLGDYSRDRFGKAWTDDNTGRTGGNRCDTRNDILGEQLTEVRKSGRCIVIYGKLADPYTGRTLTFAYGVCRSGQRDGCSAAIQLDHVVPLSDAWQKGAQALTAAQRVDLANDPDNLQATDGPTNAAKGDSDAATWLPPNRGYWCSYVARQIGVKVKYKLSVTQAEHDRMAEILKGC